MRNVLIALMPLLMTAQIVHRAQQSLEIRYWLLEPETHQFRISHDFSIERPGQKYVHSFVRKGSVVSPDAKITCLDTGKQLKTYTVKGSAVNELGYYPTPTDPDSVVVQADLETPVGEGLSTRVRVEETYTDPVGYGPKDGELVWERSLGRPFNQVTLPSGWMLKSLNTPAMIGTDNEGRVMLRFINIRADQLSVKLVARRRPAKQ